MTGQKFTGRSRGVVIGLIAIGTLVGFFAWQLFVPHRYESGGPLTLVQAKSYSPIDLPPTAHDIQIATFSHWIQFAQYVRFEARAADCEAYAKTLKPGAVGSAINASASASFQSPFNPGSFHDLSPFDVRGIKNGLYFGAMSSSEPRVWVDKDRGIFYYMLTD